MTNKRNSCGFCGHVDCQHVRLIEEFDAAADYLRRRGLLIPDGFMCTPVTRCETRLQPMESATDDDRPETVPEHAARVVLYVWDAPESFPGQFRVVSTHRPNARFGHATAIDKILDGLDIPTGPDINVTADLTEREHQFLQELAKAPTPIDGLHELARKLLNQS